MSELQDLLAELDMEDFLDEECIEYRHRDGSSGPQLNVKECPSCGDDRWRVYINSETGLGNCFHGGCDMSTFNKFGFIKASLDLDSNKAVVNQIKRFMSGRGWRPTRKVERLVPKVPPMLGAYPTGSFCIADSAESTIPYLKSRRVSEEAIRRFDLLYCPRGTYSYTDSSGAVKVQDYSERVIIPIRDLDGKVITFQGRSINSGSLPKYKFPPAIPVAGKCLFNAFSALGLGAEEIVVAEGVFDVISLWDGFRGDRDLGSVVPVGTFGMHLARDQLEMIRRLKMGGLKRVTFMWDGEKAATELAVASAKAVHALGIETRIAILPPGKDPGDCDPGETHCLYYSAVDPNSSEGKKRLLGIMLGR